MAAESSGRISKSIEFSAVTIICAWLLVLVIPIAGSLLAIDRFLAEYELFAEPGEMERACQKIEECRDLLVTENFLTSRQNALENIALPTDAQNLDELHKHFDHAIAGRSLMLVLFNEDGSRLMIRKYSPPDLNRRMPPSALFRKQVQTLIKYNYLSQPDSEPSEDPEALRNAMQMQQMFKTIAPVFIVPGQAVKSYSVEFGGELYFLWVEFKTPQAGQKGGLAVVRGRDLSWKTRFQDIRKKYPDFRLALKKQNIMKAIKNPDSFYTGVRKVNGDVIITTSADQRFIRSWLHNSGILLNMTAVFTN